MKFVHFSRAPVGAVVSRCQSEEARGMPMLKPDGFWFSVEETGNDDGWRDWCISEGFHLGNLTHVHDVTLAADANVLRLSDAAGIDAFSKSYLIPSTFFRLGLAIDWLHVAQDYQGLIIAPYVWERRLTMGADWYYTWDCASGCIWDARAIESVTLREIVPVPERIES